MFRKFLVAMAALSLLSVAAFAHAHRDFDDVPNGHPNFEAIGMLAQEGLINGYPDGTFRPEALVNRAEMAALIVRGLDDFAGNEGGENCFSDVGNQWFAEYVCFGKNTESRQWLSGYPGTTEFRPGNNVNFVETLRMVLDAYELEIVGSENGEWYERYIFTANKIGAIDGENSFDPGQKMNRGDIAEIIYRTREYLDGTDQTPELSDLSELSGEIDLATYNYDWDVEEGVLSFYKVDKNGAWNTRNVDSELMHSGSGYGQSPHFQFFGDKLYTTQQVYSDDWNEFLGEGEILGLNIVEIDPESGEEKIIAKMDGGYTTYVWVPTRIGVVALVHTDGEQNTDLYNFGYDGTVRMLLDDEKLDMALDKTRIYRSGTIMYSVLAEVEGAVYEFYYDGHTDSSGKNLTNLGLDIEPGDFCQIDTETGYIATEYQDYGLEISKIDLDGGFALEKLYETDPSRMQYVRVMDCSSENMFAEMGIVGQPENSWITMNPGQDDEKIIGVGTLVGVTEDYVIYLRDRKPGADGMLTAYEIATGKYFDINLQHDARYDNLYFK